MCDGRDCSRQTALLDVKVRMREGWMDKGVCVMAGTVADKQHYWM